MKPFCVQAPEVLYEAFLKGIPERSFKNAQPYSHGREGVARKIICNENATQVSFVPQLNVWRLKRSLFSGNTRAPKLRLIGHLILLNNSKPMKYQTDDSGYQGKPNERFDQRQYATATA